MGLVKILLSSVLLIAVNSQLAIQLITSELTPTDCLNYLESDMVLAVGSIEK
jgi:hypothetical protein